MSPRPILKRSAHHHHPSHQSHQPHHPQAHHPHHQHGVHFPPSPSLTRTFTAHSAAAYDRSPIVVTPNSCALPERGCPGRTYLLEETDEAKSRPSRYPRGIAYARDYHPRALAFASSTNGGGSSSMVPQLIPDMSSESEESDSLPAELSTTYATTNNAKQHNSYSNLPNLNVNMVDPYSSNTSYTPTDLNNYLPYPPPSPISPASPSGYHWDAHPDGTHNTQKPRRKKDVRRHDSSRDPDRIPISGAVDVPAHSFGTGSLSISPPSPIAYSSSGSPTSPSSPRKKGVRRTQGAVRPPASSFVGGGFGMNDDGCLGGF
ncbi:hypothetical protein M413DRAFT_445003 [Hebeloma cylindrosporum]|uniref:Uncharacterized protein n=1 Tax=Hebeloma cylindrosporum TaxID=76867 RepID=A0A0C3CDU0_HEBCY|nr:hypothetical protein M413DRAFT_445003 [Hebeloma cylindrosporum h7]